jgi:putative hydrolase of the HAD superfamily
MNYNWAAMTIKSLLFDFDGLILDTETLEIDIWKSTYSEYGFEFPLDLYIQTVGGWGVSTFDAADHLHKLTNDSLDVNALRLRHKEAINRRFLAAPIQDGVQEYLTEAKRLKLRLAIASSNTHAWVEPHLIRFGLIDYFEKIICGDDLPPGRTKPNPDIYIKTLNELGITASEAIVFEDSPNGVTAAHTAGIYVVAVPNPTTSLMNIEGADLKINSLASLPLQDLISRVAE